MTLTLDSIEYPPGSGTYIDISQSSDYGGQFLYRNPQGFGASIREDARAGQNPSFHSISPGNRMIPLNFYDNAGDEEAFASNLFKWFNPRARASDGDTTRKLKVLWHDGSTELIIPVNVRQIYERHTGAIDIEVQSTREYFEETSAETPVAGGVAITNGGNVDAPCLITITGGTAPNTAYRFDITDNTGKGATDVPVVLDMASSVLGTPSQCYVYDQYGDSKLFAVASSRYIWTTVSVGPSETISLYAFVSSGLSNSKANTLSWGTFYTANTSNASQESDGFTLSQNPSRRGVWVPAKMDFFGGLESSWSADVADGATSMVMTLSDAEVKTPADSIYIVTGLPADSITGLSRVWADHGTGAQSYVRYQSIGSTQWVDAWVSTGDSGSATGTITLVDAVVIAIGIEPVGDTPADGATLTLSGTGTPDITVNLDASNDLTVTRSSTIIPTSEILDGTITNSVTGQTITLSDLIYVDSGTTRMLLDFRPDADQRMYTEDSGGVIFGPPGAIQFSDPINGISAPPGFSTMTETLAASITTTWTNSYG